VWHKLSHFLDDLFMLFMSDTWCHGNMSHNVTWYFLAPHISANVPHWLISMNTTSGPKWAKVFTTVNVIPYSLNEQVMTYNMVGGIMCHATYIIPTNKHGHLGVANVDTLVKYTHHSFQWVSHDVTGVNDVMWCLLTYNTCNSWCKCYATTLWQQLMQHWCNMVHQ